MEVNRFLFSYTGPFLKFFLNKEMKLSKTVQKYLKNIEKADLHKLKDQKEIVPRRRNISEADKEIIASIIDKRIERKMEKIL